MFMDGFEKRMGQIQRLVEFVEGDEYKDWDMTRIEAELERVNADIERLERQIGMQGHLKVVLEGVDSEIEHQLNLLKAAKRKLASLLQEKEALFVKQVKEEADIAREAVIETRSE